MKMTKEHFESLVFLIGKIAIPRIKEHEAFVKAEGRYTDLNKRMRWDILRMAAPPNWVCDNLYPYLNDEHIDTALKKAMTIYEIPYSN